MEGERKAFEKWFEDDALPLEADWFRRAADDHDDYALDFVDWCWAGWQGAAEKYKKAPS